MSEHRAASERHSHVSTTDTPRGSLAGPQPDAVEAAELADDESATDAAGAEASDLSRDLVFDALKNGRRRLVLRYLNEHESGVTLSDLAEHIAAIENDTTVAAISSQQRKRVYVGLYQCHLPRLDDMGVVEFERSRGTVELGPAAPQLEPYLYLDDDPDGYRSHLEVAGLVGMVLLAGLATGVLSGTGLVLVVFGIFTGVAGLAGAHLLGRWR